MFLNKFSILLFPSLDRNGNFYMQEDNSLKIFWQLLKGKGTYASCFSLDP